MGTYTLNIHMYVLLYTHIFGHIVYVYYNDVIENIIILCRIRCTDKEELLYTSIRRREQNKKAYNNIDTTIFAYYT